jgi:hypothetical protein
VTRISIIEQARLKAEVALEKKIEDGLQRLHSAISTVFSREDASAATYYSRTGPLVIFAELDGVIFRLNDARELLVLVSGENVATGNCATILTSGDLHTWANNAVVAAQIVDRTGWKPQVTPA